MSRHYILYNPLAGGGFSSEKEKKVKKLFLGKDNEFLDITEINYSDFFENKLMPDDTIVLVGGDGTLNRFINDTVEFEKTNPIFYLAFGTGNDFMYDIDADSETPVQINKYLKNLPYVIVNDKKYFFINGIGYGIDGYCCEEGDELRLKSTKPVNYTAIAIKGLLYKFKPLNATVTVDNIKRSFNKVWLAPTMKGRCYGGGMKPTPNQDRLNSEQTLSTLIWHDSGKMRTLMAFPSIFEGGHLKYKNMCELFTGKHVVVEFDRPCALQIDGETIRNVTKYEAFATND